MSVVSDICLLSFNEVLQWSMMWIVKKTDQSIPAWSMMNLSVKSQQNTTYTVTTVLIIINIVCLYLFQILDQQSKHFITFDDCIYICMSLDNILTPQTKSLFATCTCKHKVMFWHLTQIIYVIYYCSRLHVRSMWTLIITVCEFQIPVYRFILTPGQLDPRGLKFPRVSSPPGLKIPWPGRLDPHPVLIFWILKKVN